MVAPSPSPRRISTPSWLDLRLVLGVVLVLVAVLLGATLLSRASDTDPVVTVNQNLAAGTVLRSDDLTVRQVRLPGGSRSDYVVDTDAAIGRTLGRAVSQGELLPAAALAHPAALTTITVPLSTSSAPDLHAGQRIELWLSTTRCPSVVLLDDVTVQDVGNDSSGTFDDGTNAQDVVISVPPGLAGRVIAAQAIPNVQIRAGILSGDDGSVTSVLPAASGGGLPSDLAGCVSGQR